jgi:multidrug efflux pump subunit AcrA (membrane-fusion protein)
MKKLIAFILLVGLGAGGWYYWKSKHDVPVAAGPELVPVQVTRGDVLQAVASTGRVVSNLDVDIKCKASGAVIKLPFDVSDHVHQGDLLLELDPVDQLRVVNQAEVALAQSQAKLAQAKQNLDIAEKDLATTKERVAALLTAAQRKVKDAEAKAERRRELLEKNLGTQEDYDTAQTAAIQAQADLLGVQIQQEEIKSQEVAIEVKKQDIELAKQQARKDQISLDDANQRFADTKVTSPMDAVVSARNIQIGTIISSGITNVGGGTTILTLSDLSHVYVLASVDESDIGKVADPNRAQQMPQTRPATQPANRPEHEARTRGGDRPTTNPAGPRGTRRRSEQPEPYHPQAVNITVDSFPGEKFKGQIVRVATKGVNVTNVVTFEVKIEVISPNKWKLKPEMTANVQIIAEERNDVLTLPTEAITRKEGKTVVLLPRAGEAPPEERPVQVGMSDGNNYEVISGVTEGETVLMRKGEADSKWRSDARRVAGMMGMGGPPRRGGR